MANEGGSIRANYEIDFSTLNQQLRDVDSKAATSNKRTDLAIAKAAAAQKIVDRLDVTSGLISKRVAKLGARLVVTSVLGNTLEQEIDQSNLSNTAKGFSKIGLNAAEGAFESGGNPIVIITKIAVSLYQQQRELQARIKAVEERQVVERARVQAIVDRSREQQERLDKAMEERTKKRTEKVQKDAADMEYEVWKLTGGADE